MLYFQHKFFADWEPNDSESDEDYSSSMGSDEEGEESEDEEDDEDIEGEMNADRNSVLVTPGGVSLQS